MSIPVPGAAIERLTSLADHARVRIDALLGVAALSPVEGSDGHAASRERRWLHGPFVAARLPILGIRQPLADTAPPRSGG
jgi:hypothetical protein